jgi:hypothetical protein
LELAGAQSPGEVAKEVRKRLTAIARSQSFVDWQNRRILVEDLETQRRAIIDPVAKADSAEALELLWRFMALANPVFGRCDDSSETVIAVFHAACRDLGEIAQAAELAPEVLAERAFSALNESDYGQYDDLIRTLSPALGPTGLEQLKERFLELSKAPLEKPKDKDRRLIGWGVGGALYADEISSRGRETTIRLALQMPRATLMRSSRSRAKRPRLCQEWRPKSRGDFWRRTALMRPGRRSTRSTKTGPAGSRSNGMRYASR